MVLQLFGRFLSLSLSLPGSTWFYLALPGSTSLYLYLFIYLSIYLFYNNTYTATTVFFSFSEACLCANFCCTFLASPSSFPHTVLFSCDFRRRAAKTSTVFKHIHTCIYLYLVRLSPRTQRRHTAPLPNSKRDVLHATQQSATASCMTVARSGGDVGECVSDEVGTRPSGQRQKGAQHEGGGV